MATQPCYLLPTYLRYNAHAQKRVERKPYNNSYKRCEDDNKHARGQLHRSPDPRRTATMKS